MAGAVRDDSYESAALPVLEDGGIRFERLSDLDCAKRWPQINFDGVSWSVYEPVSGFPAARRGGEAVFDAFLKSGGQYHCESNGRHHGEGATSSRLTFMCLHLGRGSAEFSYAAGYHLVSIAKIHPERALQMLR